VLLQVPKWFKATFDINLPFDDVSGLFGFTDIAEVRRGCQAGTLLLLIFNISYLACLLSNDDRIGRPAPRCSNT
jgi:hypothetical protein